MRKLKIHWSIVSRVLQVNEMLYDAGFNTRIHIDFKEDDDGNRIYYQEESHERHS